MEKAKKKCNPLWHYVAKNQYVVLCVSGDSDQAKEIIEKAFK